MKLSTATRRAIEYRLFELDLKNLENNRSATPSESTAWRIEQERSDLLADLKSSYESIIDA